MDAPMTGIGEPDSQDVAMSPLDFESFIDFQEDNIGERSCEDAGPSTVSSGRPQVFRSESLANTPADLPMSSGLSVDDGLYIDPLQPQRDYFALVNQPTLDYADPAPTQLCDLPTMSNYQPFEPPLTPVFPQGPDQSAQLAAYYTQAAEYYRFRADLYNGNMVFLGDRTMNARLSDEVSLSPRALMADLDATLDDFSSGTASGLSQQPASSQSSLKKPTYKKAEVSEVPEGVAAACIQRETLTGTGIQRYSKTDPEALNTRTKQRLEFDPRSVYAQLALPLDSWGNGLFHYTLNAELFPGSLFSVDELHQYLYEHPLHTDASGQYDPKNSGLRLWVQRNPADSKRRYGHDASSRCRLSDCCARLNLIGQAAFRVVFDERHKHEDYDPLHNAGCIHLFCLEKHFDFPDICAKLNVRAEDRSLPKEPGGRNRMMFSSIGELRVCQQFIQACENDEVPSSYSRQPHWKHVGSLCHMLAVRKVANEPMKQKITRAERGARASWETHLGDLEVENRERWHSRRANRGPDLKRKLGLHSPSTKRPRYKSTRAVKVPHSESDEDEVVMEDSEDD